MIFTETSVYDRRHFYEQKSPFEDFKETNWLDFATYQERDGKK